jgi:folate-binding protein YgfZ
LQAAGFIEARLEDYDGLRIGLGVPDGSRDLEVEKSLLLESGFDELNGLDWDKGCYMGQELTARTRYRGLTKKRLLPVEIDGPVPESDTVVRCGEREAGVLRSTADGRGLALLRLEHLGEEAAPLTAGEARLTVVKPYWARF